MWDNLQEEIEEEFQALYRRDQDQRTRQTEQLLTWRRERQKVYQAKWYRSHRQEQLERVRAWRHLNPEKHKTYYAAAKERINRVRRERYRRNHPKKPYLMTPAAIASRKYKEKIRCQKLKSEKTTKSSPSE